MFYFKRFISYMDYFENGEKIKNAGHAKVVIENNKCTLDIHIKGLKQSDSLTVPIQTLQGITLGRIELMQGIGRYEAVYPADDIDGLGTSIETITGLQIPVSECRFCNTIWKKEKLEQVDSIELQTKAAEQLNLEEVVSQKQTEEAEREQVTCHSTDRDTIYDDKWRQLCHIYKKVHPFDDDDEFISIEPKDFVIMRQEYQHLVNNSFLLHGFYNYRHVILGKRKGSRQYYIGVPGTYYEREKMVAVMFGFEGFEVSGEETVNNRIEQGTYGYYMRKVEL